MSLRRSCLGRLTVIALSLAWGCSSGTAGNAKADTAAQLAVTAELSKLSVNAGKLTCNGTVPGVIDCLGKSKDGKVIDATITAQGSTATCHGPLIVDLAGKPIANIAEIACH